MRLELQPNTIHRREASSISARRIKRHTGAKSAGVFGEGNVCSATMESTSAPLGNVVRRSHALPNCPPCMVSGSSTVITEAGGARVGVCRSELFSPARCKVVTRHPVLRRGAHNTFAELSAHWQLAWGASGRRRLPRCSPGARKASEGWGSGTGDGDVTRLRTEQKEWCENRGNYNTALNYIYLI